MVDLLLHASYCFGDCVEDPVLSQSCGALKQTLLHMKGCKINECEICKYVNQLIKSHASGCELEDCPVVNCSALR